MHVGAMPGPPPAALVGAPAGLEERAGVAALTQLWARGRPAIVDEALRSVLASRERTRGSCRARPWSYEISPGRRSGLPFRRALATLRLGLDPLERDLGGAQARPTGSGSVQPPPAGYLSAAVVECDGHFIWATAPDPGWGQPRPRVAGAR